MEEEEEDLDDLLLAAAGWEVDGEDEGCGDHDGKGQDATRGRRLRLKRTREACEKHAIAVPSNRYYYTWSVQPLGTPAAAGRARRPPDTRATCAAL